MTLRSDDLQVTHLAGETTHGTPVTANKQLPNTKILIMPAGAPNEEYMADGHLIPSSNTNNLEWSDGKWDAPPTFDESFFMLDSIYGIATPVPGPLTIAQTRTYPIAIQTPIVYRSYSVERGITGAVNKYANVVFNTHHFVISKRDKPMMDGNVFGQLVTPAVAFTAPSPTVLKSSPISNMQFDLYSATTYALLSTAPTLISTAFRLDYTYGPAFGEAAFIGSASPTWDSLGSIVPATKVLLTLPFDVAGTDFVGLLNLSAKRNGTPVYLRLKATGVTLETGIVQTFIVDLVLRARNVPNMNQIDKAKFVGLQWECGLFIDEVAQAAGQFQTICETA
jgi:hypothetical protein